MPDRGAVLHSARTLFELQLATARAHPLFRPGLCHSARRLLCGRQHCVEHGEGLSDGDAQTVWEEVALALSNVLSMKDLLAQLTAADQLIVQRSLHLQHSDVSVQAVPDAVAFYYERPPLIVDWKAHAFGLSDAWLQLAIYAMALVRTKPHSDFPTSLRRWQEEDIELVEAQLLTNRVRRHEIGPGRNPRGRGIHSGER